MDLPQAGCDSQILLNEILTCIRDAVLVTDLDGHILFSSPVVEKVLGFKSDELEGKDLSAIFTPKDLHFFYPNLLRMAQKNMPFEGELMLLHKDGSSFFASMAFRSYYDPRQGRTIIAVCVKDIHKIKQLEKALRESYYEELVQIANGIAHEIRNPLMAIGGFVNRLLKSDRHFEIHRKYYDYIIINLKKIEDLIKKVDFFASLPKPSLSEESASKLVNMALEPFVQKIQDQKIDVNITMEEIILLVDKDLVIKAISILIANALDALSEGGKIMIHNSRDDLYGRISISDTGSGISPDDLPHIFNPFFSTKPDGAGVDLSTAKRIMESHGGRIEVTSEKGKGAIFTLLFPLERRQPLRTLPLVE